MFVNYFRHPERETVVTVAAVRVLTCCYAIWKLLSYDWWSLNDWPSFFFTEGDHLYLVPGDWYLALIPAQVWITVLLLCSVAIGYRVGLTAFVSSLSLAQLSGVHYMVTNSASTWLPTVYLLLLLALYRYEDEISVDGFRRTRKQSLSKLNAVLRKNQNSQKNPQVLRWGLLIIGATYFLTGYHKVVSGAVAWASAQNIGRSILRESATHLGQTPPVGEFLLAYPTLLWVVGIATIVLEGGFIVAIIRGWWFTPFVIGIIGMHTGIALAMHIFFFDQYILLGLMLPWHSLWERVTGENELIVLYDEHCYFCARSLYLFTRLDVLDTVDFQSQSDIGEEYLQREGVKPDEAMYVFDNDETFEGYHAFRRLLKKFGPLRPVAWVLNRQPVRSVGERVYRYIAANRDRHFVCSIEGDSKP